MTRTRITILFFIFFSLLFACAAHPFSAHAQTVHYGASAPKDTDRDGLTDQGEIQLYHTDPNKADTDGDGYLDGAEVILGSDPLNAQDPAQYIVAAASDGTPVVRTIPWPWYIARASGLGAYLLLFVVVVMGIGIYTKFITKIFRSENAFTLHKHFSIFAGIMVAAHSIALVFDAVMRFKPYELFVPFASHFKPLYAAEGTFAFYLLLVILISSLFFRLRFSRQWRKLHYLTYPLFFLGFIHGVSIGSDSAQPIIHAMYWTTGIIGCTLLAYRIAYPHMHKRYAVTAKTIYQATPDVVALELAQENGKEFPQFKPGQYVALAAYDTSGKMGRKHYFSIASSPTNKKSLWFGIRILGPFTQSIARMRAGGSLALFGPYGDFVFEPEKMRRVVFIAGGVGITPFLSSIQYATDNTLANDLTLIYSNRTKTSAAFADGIRGLEKNNPHFKAYLLMSDEKPATEEETRLFGMLDEAKLRYCVNDTFADTYFFLCGPPPFMNATIKLLQRMGVSPYFIRKEQFYGS